MSLTTLIQVTPGNLPSPYCFTTFQRLNEDILTNAIYEFQSNIGNTFFNWGSTTPSTDNEIYPWLRTDAGFLDGWYNHTGNGWLKANPEAASSIKRIILVGSESDVWSYDGGDGSDPSVVGNLGNYFGAMWEIDTAMALKIPMGAGTLPVAGVLAIGATLGAETHTLTAAELPAHKHLEAGIFTPDHPETYDAGTGNVTDATASGKAIDVTSAGGHDRIRPYTANDGGDGDAHSILPPVYGVYFCKRTSRIFYKV